MIKSLAGVMHLTGLTRLSATGNKISSLDFSDAEWSVVSLSFSGSPADVQAQFGDVRTV